MKPLFRVTCAVLSALLLHLFLVPSLVAPCLAADVPSPAGAAQKITVNDPQFIPLSEPKSLREGPKWYWYVIGAAVIGGGIAAAAAGGGGNDSTSGPASGSVTGRW